MSNVFAWIRGSAAGCVLMIAASLVLAGCGSDDDNKNYVEQPVEVLYNRAMDDLGAQNYKAAAKGFEEVDRQHPYSVWATKAQIMAAFTYYQSNKYDDAVIALDRFIFALGIRHVGETTARALAGTPLAALAVALQPETSPRPTAPFSICRRCIHTSWWIFNQ